MVKEYKCKMCQDNGYVMYKKKVNNIEYEYVAHCSCNKR